MWVILNLLSQLDIQSSFLTSVSAFRALDCIPGELREKIIELRETRNKYHDLYKSVNNISTTDALNLFGQRTIIQGEQNSDGSVIDSYYGQLQSLIAESPVIEVQFRD